jgi:hypothetical protein
MPGRIARNRKRLAVDAGRFLRLRAPPFPRLWQLLIARDQLGKKSGARQMRGFPPDGTANLNERAALRRARHCAADRIHGRLLSQMDTSTSCMDTKSQTACRVRRLPATLRIV